MGKMQNSAHLSMEARRVFYLRLVMNCGNLSGCEDRVPPGNLLSADEKLTKLWNGFVKQIS